MRPRASSRSSASAVERAMGEGWPSRSICNAPPPQPVVFHDRRSTGSRRRRAGRRARAPRLCIPLRNSKDCILTLPALLGLVEGSVPLLSR
jgi:hypothetical protein